MRISSSYLIDLGATQKKMFCVLLHVTQEGGNLSSYASIIVGVEDEIV